MSELIVTFNIFNYHWVWYCIGFLVCPRLTIMIWISLYYAYLIPLPLMILGWIYAVIPSITIKRS